MHITLDQKIAGYPACQIRQLMRETVGRSITLRYVREILQCSDSAAIQVLNHLQVQGFVEPILGHLEPSTKGSALAMATAAAPLRRETAERLIADVIERARSVNEDERWSYRIGTLVVLAASCTARNVPMMWTSRVSCVLDGRVRDKRWKNRLEGKREGNRSVI